MDVGRIRSIRAGRVVALAAAALLFGCAGERAPGAAPGAGGQRSPTGVFGKPLVETPTGVVIADELVAIFRAGTPRDRVEEAAAGVGGEVIMQGTRTGAYVIRFEDGESAAAAVAALRGHEDALEVRRSHVTGGTGVGTSPSLMDIQWNFWGLELDPFEDPGDGYGTLVAVLDTGAAYEDYSDATATYATAPDLSGTSFVSGWDFIGDDAHPNDDHGHGTHVTGVIAASSGITPLAGGAGVMPVKVLDVANMGTEIGLAEGILFAADGGADVMNMSLSFSPAFFPSRFLQDAVNQAAEQGVVMVAAVGNHGGAGVPFPAAFRDVIAVGSSRVGEDFRLDPGERTWHKLAWRGLDPAGYSNRGFLVDVSAPGGVVDQDIDGDGNPEAIVAQSFQDDPTDFEYLLFAGTSQAAAQVSALAARALHESDSMSAARVRALLGENTLRGSDGRVVLDEQVGRGHVSARDSMHAVETQPASSIERATFSASVELAFDEGDGGNHGHGKGWGWWGVWGWSGWGWGWGHDEDGPHGGGDEDAGDDRFARAEVQVFTAEGAPANRVRVYGTFTGGMHEPVIGRTDQDGRAVFYSPALEVDTRLIGFQVDAIATTSRQVVDRPEGAIRIDSCSLDRLGRFADSLAGATPITVRREGSDSLQLLNFSPGLATVPMAVAVEDDWFYTAFPGAEAGTVTVTGESFSLDDDVEPGPDDSPCVDLLLRTFSTPTDTVAPLSTDPDGSCEEDGSCVEIQTLLSSLWQGSAPAYDASLGVSFELYDHLTQVVGAYAAFQGHPAAAAVSSYSDVLSAAGMERVPYDGPHSDGSGVTSMSQ